MAKENYPRPTWMETDEYFANEKRIQQLLDAAELVKERYGDEECEHFLNALRSPQESKSSE